MRLGFHFLCCSLKRLGLPTNLLLLSLPLCPDHSSCSSPAHRGREQQEGLRAVPAQHQCPACSSCSDQQSSLCFQKGWKKQMSFHKFEIHQPLPQWLSLQTPFLKIMFWYRLWFLLCSVSEFQQVKYNKILSLTQLVISGTKKSFSLALPLIASLKGL